MFEVPDWTQSVKPGDGTDWIAGIRYRGQPSSTIEKQDQVSLDEAERIAI
jgi:hypothetical protein